MAQAPVCQNSKLFNNSIKLCELSNQFKAMSGKRKLVACKDDTLTPKRKIHFEVPDVNDSKESVSDGTTTPEFNDMCDDVIDMILCALRLEDLANIYDTSIRLRAIAISVFSRRYAHHLISIDAFHYSNYPSDEWNKALQQHIPYSRRYNKLVRINDAKVWFKLVRNFGASMKHVRIQSNDFNGISIPNTLAQFVKYISELCSDTLETLEVRSYRSFSLGQLLPNLQEFSFGPFNFENSKALELMPNLRVLYLCDCPQIMARHFAKLERVRLELRSRENVQSFNSFARLNPQIKYLHLHIYGSGNSSENNELYFSIADNFTQLKTLKLFDSALLGVTVGNLHLKMVESFSIGGPNPRYAFEFDDLKKLKLERYAAVPSYLMDLAQRNRKLKILKLRYPRKTFFDDGVIRNVLNKLPELEQILICGLDEYEYPIFKHLLGGEWEQFEKEGTVKFESYFMERYRRFRKINSKA